MSTQPATGPIPILAWDRPAIDYFLSRKLERLDRRYLIEASGNSIADWLGLSEIRNEERQIDEEISDYLLRHTRLLPRDIVLLGNALSTAVARARGAGRAFLEESEVRQLVKMVATWCGTEQLEICGAQLLGDMIPHGAVRKAELEAYTANQEYERSLGEQIAALIRSIGEDQFDRRTLEEFAERGRTQFHESIDLSTVLWQNGRIRGRRDRCGRLDLPWDRGSRSLSSAGRSRPLRVPSLPARCTRVPWRRAGHEASPSVAAERLMSSIRRVPCASWAAFKAELFPTLFGSDEFREGSYVFRGTADADWTLRSSFDRYAESMPLGQRPEEAERLLAAFAEECESDNSIEPCPEKKVQRLAVAQHYGLPTRTLDWTESPYVASYFAFADVRPGTARAKLRSGPSRLSTKLGVAVGATILSGASRDNERMLRQRGVLTYLQAPYDNPGGARRSGRRRRASPRSVSPTESRVDCCSDRSASDGDI